MIVKNPLKDYHIFRNEDDIYIVKGVEIEVPDIYKHNLITEGIINKPKEKNGVK